MSDQQQDNNEKGFFRISGVSRSVRVYLPATVIYRGMSFFRGIVLAWLLAKQTGQYGLLSISLQAINILAPLVSLGLNEAITRYVPAYRENQELRGFLKLAGSLTLGISVIFTLILLALSNPLSRAIFAGESLPAGEAAPLTTATLVAVFVIIAYFLVIAVLKGLRMFTALALMEVVHGTLFLGLSLAAVLMIGARADVVIWSYIAAMIIPTVIWGIGLLKNLPADKTVEGLSIQSAPLARRLIPFGFWAAVGGILWQTWQIYSLWHLTKFTSAHAGDLFAAARLLGQLILIVGSALAAIVMTNVCVIWEKGIHQRALFLHDLYTKIILLGLLLAGLMIVLLRQPLAIIFPAKFGSMSEFLPPVVAYYQLSAMLSFLAIQFVMLEKMRQVLWPWMTGLIGNVFLAILMVRGESAAMGAANAAVLSALPAIGVAMLLLRSEGGEISRGIVLISLASGILLLPTWLAIIVFGVLIGWAVGGKTLFSPDQKRILAAKLPFRQNGGL